MMTTTLSVPRVTAEHVRGMLDGAAESLLVWLPLTNDLELAPGGLTAAQADSADIVPVFTTERVEAYVRANHGIYEFAAIAMTTELRDTMTRGLL